MSSSASPCVGLPSIPLSICKAVSSRRYAASIYGGKDRANLVPGLPKRRRDGCYLHQRAAPQAGVDCVGDRGEPALQQRLVGYQHSWSVHCRLGPLQPSSADTATVSRLLIAPSTAFSRLGLWHTTLASAGEQHPEHPQFCMVLNCRPLYKVLAL